MILEICDNLLKLSNKNNRTPAFFFFFFFFDIRNSNYVAKFFLSNVFSLLQKIDALSELRKIKCKFMEQYTKRDYNLVFLENL